MLFNTQISLKLDKPHFLLINLLQMGSEIFFKKETDFLAIFFPEYQKKFSLNCVSLKVTFAVNN